MRIRPWVNYALVAANVLLFLLTMYSQSVRLPVDIGRFLLRPENPHLYQFFSSMFLHSSWGHLIGNMVFLWVFGNALNDRLGHVSYLLFYLGGGIVAGLGHMILTPAPALGASGAISAVVGAYLVLFPRTHITLLMWFYFITTFEVSSLLFIGIQIAFNFYMSYHDIVGSKLGGVAYVAHSSGYLFGLIVAVGLLAGRLLPRDGNDLLNMIRQTVRRRRYRRLAGAGPDPFAPNRLHRTDEPGQAQATTVSVAERTDTPAGQEMQLRRDIASAATRGDLATAAELYGQVLAVNADIVLPRQQQLDIANQLMTMEQYAAAAEAYERFLKHYSFYEHVADIRLMLGLIYNRYQKNYPRAIELLTAAAEKLTDPHNKGLAQAELQAARQKLDS